jgi:hypothetical protein
MRTLKVALLYARYTLATFTTIAFGLPGHGIVLN